MRLFAAATMATAPPYVQSAAAATSLVLPVALVACSRS
jgi:hypothetical protein